VLPWLRGAPVYAAGRLRHLDGYPPRLSGQERVSRVSLCCATLILLMLT
jgi:hypothetical protein